MQPYHDYLSLRKEALKFWDHGITDKLIYLDQIIEGDRKILGGINGQIPKHYLKGSVWFEIHLTFVFDGNADHLLLCVEFEKPPNSTLAKIQRQLLTMNRNSPMLVDVAQSIELGQEMIRGICSVVRLKRFDDSHCCCGYSRRVLGELGSVARRVMVKDRKLGMRGISSQFSLGKCPNGLIKGGAKTVKTISSDKRYSPGNLIDLDPNTVTSGFYIVLAKDTYRIGFSKNSDLMPQGIKVFLRPLGLMVGVLQGDARLFG